MRTYETKAANYSIDLRVKDLKNIVEVQKEQGLEDPYMRGMYNGLALAWSIIAEPYGAEPEYAEKDGSIPASTRVDKKHE